MNLMSLKEQTLSVLQSSWSKLKNFWVASRSWLTARLEVSKSMMQSEVKTLLSIVLGALLTFVFLGWFLTKWLSL